MNKGTELYGQMLQAFESIGTKVISTETAAKILSVIHVFGGEREDFVYNGKLTTELQHIQRSYHIMGGQVPDVALVKRIQFYNKQCESARRKRLKPNWAKCLFKERYSIDL